ncbi:hypothetical protein [Xanthomonas oryzae]|uniref:hypothetical protein n=1 Tax=Xanthomonas oryzae TaxID=347 RepID=UPI00031E40AC|nr:hypothetical protein [Xanthomonas oryzae]
MFARIRQDVPSQVGDAHVAQAMRDAERNGITDAGKIDRVAMVGDTMWVAGTTPGFRSRFPRRHGYIAATSTDA